jgi:hypothetical protein
MANQGWGKDEGELGLGLEDEVFGIGLVGGKEGG